MSFLDDTDRFRRKVDTNAGTQSEGRLNFNGAADPIDDRFADAQTQPGTPGTWSGGATGVGAKKSLSHPLEICGTDTDPVIMNFE
jgi:hypothetical protein